MVTAGRRFSENAPLPIMLTFVPNVTLVNLLPVNAPLPIFVTLFPIFKVSSLLNEKAPSPDKGYGIGNCNFNKPLARKRALSDYCYAFTVYGFGD